MSNAEWISKFTSELRKKEEDLADEFFDKETATAVDFEIALAALLATLCLQYPVHGLEIPVSQISAFSLLIVTLGRRVVVSSPYAPDDLLEKTAIHIEITTTSCLLSIFAAITYKVEWISSIPYQFILISLPVMVLLAVLHELVFRDYMIWWHAKFLEKAERGGIFSDIWCIVSIISLLSSKYYRDLPGIERHRQDLPSRADFEQKFDFPIKEYMRFIVKVAVLLAVLYLIPLVAAVVIFGPTGIILIATVVIIHNHSAFWYVGYGDTSYEDFRRHPLLIILLTSFFVLETGYLLDIHSFPTML